ncbi:MAG: phenylalanine--tRNA ligase subunit beta [Planctomycetota bacterium]|nr:phenylalanine--tRNA ligase subunit beta [Planctomycetota bacterium]
MDVSYRWLGRHVDLSGVTPEEVARDLTVHTSEVEGLSRFAPVLGDVVVGVVAEHGKHPNADKLSLCKVDLGPAGEGELLPIVCGAPNVAAGQKVAVARVGTVLPGDVKLKRTKIRGEISLGMICSERELGMGDDHTGIWVLDPEAEVGRPVVEALEAEDWILAIDNKSLTHRPDLWGHRGLAAEIAAIRGLHLVPLDLALPATGSGDPYPVRVESDGCSRYLGLAIDGVRVEASPTWMKLLLLAAGQRPLDLLVDVSNFVMLDLGQPNHLFDRRRLSPEGILVRDARPGEKVTTLDGVERELTPADVLICSGDEPVAIAGVMGGEGAKVDAKTSELLLEVATFHSARIRRTAMRLGLRTDASARFEKHLDPTLPEKAAARVVSVLRSIQPDVTLPRALGDAGEWSDPARQVAVRPWRVRAVLGEDIDDGAIAESLERLGLPVTPDGPGDDRWEVSVPSARATKDLGIEEDLIEEVGRLFGYDRIPLQPIVGALTPPPHDERRLLVRRVQDALAGGARFHEVKTYSFVPDELVEKLGLADELFVEAVNPVLETSRRIRRSLMPAVLDLVDDNLRQREVVRLFEVGKAYLADRRNERDEPLEVHEAALVWAGPRPGPGATGARFDDTSLARLQGVVDDLLRELGHPVAGWERAAEYGELPTWAHPGRAMIAFGFARGGAGAEKSEAGASLAVLGALEPGLARALGSEVAAADVAGAVVSLDRLLDTPGSARTYRPLPRYPGIKLDVALAVDASLSAGETRATIEQAGKGLVAGCQLFDLYAGESVGAGRKSLAWHVLLQADDRTLSDQDEQRFLDRLEKEIGARGGELRRE